MQTRAHACNAHSSISKMLDPPLRPNTRRMQDMVHHSILGMEGRIETLEAKEVLTDSHRHSVICICKMLETICGEIKGLPLRDHGCL